MLLATSTNILFLIGIWFLFFRCGCTSSPHSVLFKKQLPLQIPYRFLDLAAVPMQTLSLVLFSASRTMSYVTACLMGRLIASPLNFLQCIGCGFCNLPIKPDTLPLGYLIINSGGKPSFGRI